MLISQLDKKKSPEEGIAPLLDLGFFSLRNASKSLEGNRSKFVLIWGSLELGFNRGLTEFWSNVDFVKLGSELADFVGELEILQILL